MGQKNEVKRKAWRKKIVDWEESGLSVQSWCLENKENYYQFKYWRQVLKENEKPLNFEELKEEDAPLDIELRFGEVTISFPKGCHPLLLEFCLKSLRKIQC